MDLPTQAAARKGIADLCDDLEDKPEAAWLPIIATALSSNKAITPYIKLVTLEAALIEAGVSDDLRLRFIAQVEARRLLKTEEIRRSQ